MAPLDESRQAAVKRGVKEDQQGIGGGNLYGHSATLPSLRPCTTFKSSQSNHVDASAAPTPFAHAFQEHAAAFIQSAAMAGGEEGCAPTDLSKDIQPPLAVAELDDDSSGVTEYEVAPSEIIEAGADDTVEIAETVAKDQVKLENADCTVKVEKFDEKREVKEIVDKAPQAKNEAIIINGGWKPKEEICNDPLPKVKPLESVIPAPSAKKADLKAMCDDFLRYDLTKLNDVERAFYESKVCVFLPTSLTSS